MRWTFCFLLCATLGAAAEELPILGLAHAGFQVTDLEKAKAFYQGVLGFEPAFQLAKPNGEGVALVYYKVNDDQYVEIFPDLAPGEDHRLTHISFYTDDIEKLHAMLDERGLKPSKINAGRDGNRNFGIRDPEGFRLEITGYMPGSLHSNARGKLAGDRRISSHLLHAGIVVTDVDAALKFYRDQLGFREFWRGGPKDGEIRWINLRLPGPRGDYIELMITQPNPSRQQLGSMQHICLEVPDIQAAYQRAMERGTPAEDRHQPRVGRNGRWQLNLYDPDGSRTELMEPKLAAERH